MKATEAVEQIRSTAFKPGWRFEGRHYGGDLVLVELLIDTVDTSYPDADGVCRERIRILGGDKLVNVAALDEAALCVELLAIADEADEHENREFLKVRQPDGSWKAPLHPHTNEGNAAWRRNRMRPPASYPAPADAFDGASLLRALGLE
jgi:hypothetical protein